MKKCLFSPLAICIGVSLLFAFPIIENISFWGQMDWDQFSFWNAVPRETILRYRQFPLWNPYVNGGNVLLAHPHSPFLSPFYGFVLFFGPIIGLKLEIIVHLIIGLMGMFLLAQFMKLDKASSYLASFIFMLSSVYALHITEGHTGWFAMAFVPWTFLYYLKSFRDNNKIFWSIVFFGFMLLAGSVDVVTVYIIFLSIYAILKTAQLRRVEPLKNLGILFIGTFFLCAVKVIPMMEFLWKFPRVTVEHSGIGLEVLYEMFLGREQALLDIDWLSFGKTHSSMDLEYQWHEYGAYIGYAPLVLLFCGIIVEFKRRWPLIVAGFICLLIALGSKSPVNLWEILHTFPVYDSLHVPSRFILAVIFSISILSGFGLLIFKKVLIKIFKKSSISWYKWFSILLTSFVFFDLCLVNSSIFKNAFIVQPIIVEKNTHFSSRYKDVYLYPKVGIYVTSHSSILPIFLSNSGILEGNEVINIKRGDVKITSDPNYQGEVYLLDTQGDVFIKQFSPNKVIVNIEIEKPGVLVMNQNYYNGWKVKKNGNITKAKAVRGLISTPVLPGDCSVEFFYMPFSFLLGLFLTLVFLLFNFIYFLRTRKWVGFGKSDK